MFKSSNLSSVLDGFGGVDIFTDGGEIVPFAPPALRSDTMDLPGETSGAAATSGTSSPLTSYARPPQPQQQLPGPSSAVAVVAAGASDSVEPFDTPQQLAAGLLDIFEPSLVNVKGQFKELILRQNKVIIDVSAEKYKLDNDEMNELYKMMNNVKIYREKLIKIKKQMQNIYQRTKVLKKRAANIQACKDKELHRKAQKQQQEESLIGKRI